MQQPGRILIKAGLAGVLGVALATGIAPVLAVASPLEAAEVATVQPEPAIAAVTYIGSGLGTAELSDDGRGNIIAPRYIDDMAAYLSPTFKLQGVDSQASVTMRITIDNASAHLVSRVTLTLNRFGEYEQFGSTAVSRPGAKATVVTFELLADGRQFASLTVPFAPASAAPSDFNPLAIANQLAAPASAWVADGRLHWQAVDRAERYQISALLIDSTGQAVDMWRADSDNLTDPSESIAEIQEFLDLPAGDYRFSVKASTLHNGFWNGTLASPSSNRTELVSLN
jgi:hypothetical protein